MEKKLYSFLFSTRLMAVLFLGFAAAMAAGTFIESEYNTDTARILIYNAWWFEAIMLFFMINFIGNIKRYQLYKKEKWATLLLHLSFIFIIAGAFITRYISYEGMMPIREGESSKQVYSDRCYLTAHVDGMYNGEMMRRMFEKPLLLSPITDNHFSVNEKFAEIPFEIEYQNFVFDAKETIKADPNGDTYLKLVESGDGTRHEHMLKAGEVQNIHNVLFALDKPTKGAINIDSKANTITSPFDGQFMRMADKMQGKVTKDVVEPLMYRSLYNMGGTQFVIPELPKKGVKSFESSGDFKNKTGEDALTIKVKTGGKEKVVTLVGAKGKQGEPTSFKLGQLEFTLSYGSKIYELPFSLKLNDFIAAKYPGTEKRYSSFESKVTVLDSTDKFDAHIYMNHILDYKGFRFFQANFDPDEKGTVLSVNHDFWGTTITYIGYFLLFFSMMAILFVKNTRFDDLKRKLENVKRKKAKLTTVLVLLCSLNGLAQEHGSHKNAMPTQKQIDSILNKYKVSEKHAAQFGRLVIQDDGGRMKPINTFSSELLRKVSKSDTYKGMNSDQVFISMTQFPTVWFETPLIYIKKGNDSIRKIIGIKPEDKYASFHSFFDKDWNYKLSPYLEKAYKATIPSQFEKDFIETDKKVNLLNTALSGKILKIFPVPNDPNNKWVSFLEINHTTGNALDTIKGALPVYLDALMKATETDDYTRANTFLVGMEDYQKVYGKAVRPSDDKIDSEILYNKYDVFKNLFWLYMLTGCLMLVLVIVNIFFDSKILKFTVNGFHLFIGLLFGIHTLGLIARWYISGHAPWSDAYESMIYVAWATMFFTLAFDRKSKLTVASGTFVASMILMIAHWNWMDPAIANLQPVLNSYWLMIHVAVIVASYGPFTLAMVLGIVSLLLMLFINKNNKAKMELNIKEITYINEMALTIGLVMLTIGNFLGGQWANESWGRYWGWDPKETWALISIMIYAFVIHARFVPALRNKWVYNVMSVFAFYSIMMTYFGVNFYLTGLHSYASGDKVVTPSFVYYSVAFIIVLAALSYFKYRKYLKK
ncbi:cytochrome c biogenesis protein CcsA [Flavobacterium sp. J49]|uniref:cytochrome c biogenesis protein CcsA n=1 Tax=Flavobacterium sp. J49 TaxID=2718534 RepID=UPI00159423C4|nr:cytochrome c biogenesis protein CcsA [Flavobacterium sp. J49]MBF6640819.1 cytochrome c biogenesis protein CcsA [Flavobacterium sp. J49]NIC02066.1 cytochrome c biogenesis protein CcsA [Flavobacterium sp. J49]